MMIVPAVILCYHLHQIAFTKQLILRLEVVIPGRARSELPPLISLVTLNLGSSMRTLSLQSSDTPLSPLSSLSMELIDPELQEDIHSSKSSLPATTGSVEGAHRSILTTDQDHMEGIVAEPLSSDREVANQPVVIDAEEDVWEAEMLLAKWTKGRTTWYLVK
jgi:hypothetical protein